MASGNFELVTEDAPRGDQPRAIAELVDGLSRGDPHQVLLGVTGSGKTFTMANVVAALNKPTLVVAHNKTLAAQLYGEFRRLFPKNAVEYFVSYYDYYQPEAYVPTSDTYIEKDSSINEEIERMRNSATHSLCTRSDVLIVASVSCIYGLGAAKMYMNMAIRLEQGGEQGRDDFLKRLVECQYERNEIDFHRGTFRVRGDTVEVFPVYEEARALRVEFFGDTVERISEFDPLRGGARVEVPMAVIFPGSHYVTAEDGRRKAILSIREELRERLSEFRGAGRLVEAQRLEQRTSFDLEMIEQLGFCNGIENYSRHFSGRSPGEPPPVLLDYFDRDFLVFVDESHQTIPQIGAMFRGDRARKETLVEHGFRLPSALDNRPLTFPEWEQMVKKAVYVSATPGPWELVQTQGVIVEQVIRPTGLLDPVVEVRPVAKQVDDLLGEIRERVKRSQRVLVTTLTKRMAEDLTEFYSEVGVRVRYLHSDIDALERVAIIRDLRKGVFDVLVGINLLREGLDIPETSLVAILDADKEGYLRSHTSLVQTIGRAARHVDGRVLLYADRITPSMKKAIDETARRRELQQLYNEEHGVTPSEVRGAIADMADFRSQGDPLEATTAADEEVLTKEEITALIAEAESAMHASAEAMEFEKAAEERDRLIALREMELGVRPSVRGALQSKPKEEAPRRERRGKYRRRR